MYHTKNPRRVFDSQPQPNLEHESDRTAQPQLKPIGLDCIRHWLVRSGLRGMVSTDVDGELPAIIALGRVLEVCGQTCSSPDQRYVRSGQL